VIDFVESGICLGLARDGILDRVTRKRDFVIADKVVLTCDLSFACLASRDVAVVLRPWRRRPNQGVCLGVLCQGVSSRNFARPVGGPPFPNAAPSGF